jgi:methyl-accepting chemotaxis protein
MLANMRVATKLILVIVAMGLVTLSVSIFAYWGLGELGQMVDLVEIAGHDAVLGARMNQDLVMMNRAEYRMGLAPAEADEASKVVTESARHFEERYSAAERDMRAPERKAQLAALHADFQTYLASSRKVMDLAQRHRDLKTDGPRGDILAQVHVSRAAVNALSGKVQSFVDAIDHDGAAINSQADALKARLLLLIAVVAVGGIGLGTVFGLFIARTGLTQPIKSVVGDLRQLADGKLDIDIFGTARADEVGDIGRAALVFRDNARRAAELHAKEERRQQTREERARRIEAMTEEFDRLIASVVEVVTASAQQLQTDAQGLSATADQTNQQAVAVATAAEEASSNVQTVASATEELTASVAEISRQVSQSLAIAEAAVTEADRTNITVASLAEAAQKIGQVVGLINDIASQTNLLALNATIEAARAGDAGKGFAVVASEVKNLANQTAKATDDIQAQVGQMQAATGTAVDAIKGIGSTIQRVNQIATAIAASVEEQGAATREIARNIQEAAHGTQEVSRNIGGVTVAAGETGSLAGQTLTAARDLSQEASRLRQEVDAFIDKVRRA